MKSLFLGFMLIFCFSAFASDWGVRYAWGNNLSLAFERNVHENYSFLIGPIAEGNTIDSTYQIGLKLGFGRYISILQRDNYAINLYPFAYFMPTISRHRFYTDPNSQQFSYGYSPDFSFFVLVEPELRIHKKFAIILRSIGLRFSYYKNQAKQSTYSLNSTMNENSGKFIDSIIYGFKFFF
jgi:hypothetical protein